MEDTDEFKWALKVVIKRQMRDLMEQLRERGEEIAILTVNLEDNSCSHFGSPNGEWFVSEQKNLIQNFLNFCQTKGKNKRTGYTPSYSYYSPAPAASKKPAGFKQKATPTTPDKSAATSADMPLVKVTVPRHLAGDISEEELAGLVGRIVATQLVMQEKGDGSTGGTKFDLLLDAANQSKSKDELSSVMSTPSTRSTRKRKVTAKFREGINSLKKGKKSEEEEDASEHEASHEDSMIFKILAELSSATLKRVRVKLSDETTIDVEHSMLTSSEKFESLAVQVIQELDEVASGLLTNKKNIKIEVVISKKGSKVIVETNTPKPAESRLKVKTEEVEMDDSDMEYLDSNIVHDNEEDEYEVPYLAVQSDGEYDPDQDDDFDPLFDPEDSNSSESKPRKTGSKKGKKKSLSELTPMPCDECDVVLTGISSLRAHVRRMHLKEKNNACHICDKGFYSTTHRDSHFASVHCKTCIVCGENVRETEKWTEHIDKFTERVVQCKCGETITMVTKLGRTKLEPDLPDGQRPKRKRPAIEVAPHKCDTCGLVLTGRSSLFAHVKRMHLKTLNYKCNVCSKQFFTSTHLESHMLSLHTRRCQKCQEYVMETAPWEEGIDRWKERQIPCKCGSLVTIVTKLGRKLAQNEDDEPATKKKKTSEESDTRYVCGTCGKMFIKKKEAMSHSCYDERSSTETKEDQETITVPESQPDKDKGTSGAEAEKQTKDVVTKPEEGCKFVLEEDGGSQVIMFQDETGNQNIQVMQDGKLLAAEQVIDEEGNLSLIIKHV